MGSYILCQVSRTDVPYYIERIGVNIFSIEELCFFLYNDVYLLDDTILNEGLCDWLRNQLGFRKLSQQLYPLCGTDFKTADFVLPILREINYLTSAEQKKYLQDLEIMEQQPDAVKYKMRGDTLASHNKFVNAIAVYQQTLTRIRNTNLGDQFVGSVCNNMGCAYMGMFQLQEALECLRLANENLHTRESMRRYLYALHLNLPKNEYEGKLLELGVDTSLQDEVTSEIDRAIAERFNCPTGEHYKKVIEAHESGDSIEWRKSIDKLLTELTREYHMNTGL